MNMNKAIYLVELHARRMSSTVIFPYFDRNDLEMNASMSAIRFLPVDPHMFQCSNRLHLLIGELVCVSSSSSPLYGSVS